MGPARMRESLTIREQPRPISDVAPRRLQGGGVGEVISSNHPDWKTGDIAESYSYPSSCHPTEKEMERTPSGVATRPGVPELKCSYQANAPKAVSGTSSP